MQGMLLMCFHGLWLPTRKSYTIFLRKASCLGLTSTLADSLIVVLCIAPGFCSMSESRQGFAISETPYDSHAPGRLTTYTKATVYECLLRSCCMSKICAAHGAHSLNTTPRQQRFACMFQRFAYRRVVSLVEPNVWRVLQIALVH